MKKRLILILAVASIFAIGALAFNNKVIISKKGVADSQSSLKQQSITAAPATTATSQSSDGKQLPEPHLFLHLFKHRDSLEKRTELAQQRGMSADFTNWYEQQAGLSPSQNEAFRSVAAACLAEVEKLDDQAEEIIRQVRAQYPPGKTNRVPSVPPELLELQKKRDATVLRYRDDLKARLGDGAFAGFKKFVEDKIQPNIKVLTPVQSQELSLPPGKGSPAFVDPKTKITGTLPRTTTN
jgi:hypothetical protein